MLPVVPQVLHCSVPPGHKSELVVDPGPGVLLVVHGAGKAMVRASCVSDELVLEETDLQPGERGSALSLRRCHTTVAQVAIALLLCSSCCTAYALVLTNTV